MNNLFRTCALLLLLASCNSLPSMRPLPAMLNSSKLPSQLLDINTERDTTLTLNGGTIISIPANALKAEDGKIARIEVKEALTIEQILIAGLRTQSNGTPLQSGGMIYIDAARDAKVSMLKPIQIQVPTAEILDGMQLYKGEVEKNGINWVDPQPLPSKPDMLQSNSATGIVDQLNGKVLFQTNCASCHNVHKMLTGPALKGTMQRWKGDTTMLYSFIQNSGAVIASGHCYANYLFDEFNKQAMPNFPSLTNQDITDILAYAGEWPPSDIEQTNTSFDSCQYYSTIFAMVDELENEDTFIKISDSVLNISDQLLTGDQIVDTLPAIAFKSLIAPKFNKSYYYTVDINAFGWYNIDMALKAVKEMVPSKLTVSIAEKEQQSISVFLVIPSHKIMVEGGYLKDNKLYGFYEEDGSIPLPQGTKAYIIAIGEHKLKPELYIGVTSFITSTQQSLDVTLDTSSEKEIQKEIAGLQLPDFLSKINKEEVSDKMRALRREAIRVEPMMKYCDCVEHMKWKPTAPAAYPEIETGEGNGTADDYIDITELEVDTIPVK